MLGKTNVKVKPNKSTILEFVSSIAPTTWEKVTIGTEYTAYNEYGKWRIWADTYRNSSYPVSNAFDGTNDLNWQSDSRSDNTTPTYMGIALPEGISICPKKH